MLDSQSKQKSRGTLFVLCLAILLSQSIMSALLAQENHLKKSIVPDSVASSYCKQIAAELQKSWQSRPGFTEPLAFEMFIDSQGKFEAIPAEDCNTDPATKQIALQQLASLKLMPSPPQELECPVKLSISLCNNPGKISSWLREDLGSYLRDLRHRIKRSWHPPKDSPNGTRLSFVINQNGSISNLQLIGSSGSTACDQSGLHAVEQATPLPPLPCGSSDTLDLQVSFQDGVCILKRI